MKIYIEPKTSRFYATDAKCSKCQDDILYNTALLHYCWRTRNQGNRPSIVEMLCMKCIAKKEKYYSVEENYQVLCVAEEDLPYTAIPFTKYKIELKESNKVSVFSAAYLESEKTVDNTKYANKNDNMIEYSDTEKTMIGIQKSENEN